MHVWRITESEYALVKKESGRKGMGLVFAIIRKASVVI